MAARTFDEGAVMTALCLWEAWLDFETIGYAKQQKGEEPGDTYRVLNEFRDSHGSFTCRQLMIDLAEDCDLAWEARDALNGQSDIAFDFEFCPDFLAGAAANGVLDEKIKQQYGGHGGPYSTTIVA